jgi:uncharacterized membrane protein
MNFSTANAAAFTFTYSNFCFSTQILTCNCKKARQDLSKLGAITLLYCALFLYILKSWSYYRSSKSPMQ